MKAPALGHLSQVFDTLKAGLRLLTVEPVVFIDGACYWSMSVLMDVVLMEKTCSSNLGFSYEVCTNLSAHPDENLVVQREFSIFAFYNSISLSVFSFLFVLFIGAWSDKYGRKIPFVFAQGCHILSSGVFLLATWQTTWPVEVIYLVSFLGSLGGWSEGLYSLAIAYISDVTLSENRTSRISMIVSLWYLGGPLGMLMGAVAIHHVGIEFAVAMVFFMYISVFVYVIFIIKECHGPFAKIKGDKDSKVESTIKKEDVTNIRMIADFFNWRRALESFKSVLQKREGSTRLILIMVVVGNMIRRAARGFYIYSFVRRALHWEAHEFTYWSSYRGLVSAVGSLILVPTLISLSSISDPMLIVIGSISLAGEYCSYGLIMGMSYGFFIWLGPIVGLISNANIIAQSSMATKLVSTTEKGRVSAVMAATQSLMPMFGYAMYAPIYHQTVKHFPSAEFYFAAGLIALIMITFLAIHLSNVSYGIQSTDAEVVSIERSMDIKIHLKAGSPDRKDAPVELPRKVDDDNSHAKSMQGHSEEISSGAESNSEKRS